MHASFEVQIQDGEIVCCEGSTWLPSDIILYRVKYITVCLNLNPHDFSKFRPGEIASRRDALHRSRPDNVAHTILRGLLSIPYRGMRYVLLCSTV